MDNNQNIYDSQMNLNYIPVNNNQEPPKKKNNKKFIIILSIVLALIAILIVGLLVYFFAIAKSPKNIFKYALESSFNYLSDNLANENHKTIKNNLDISLDIINQGQDENAKKLIDILNKTNLSIETQQDFENKKIATLLKLQYDNNIELNAEVYLDVKNYILDLGVKEIYDKYVEVKGNEETFAFADEYFDNKLDDEFFEVVKHASMNFIRPEYCSKEKTKLTINNNKIDVTKNTLKMNLYQLTLHLKEAFEEILNNKEFIEKNKYLEETLNYYIESMEQGLQDEESIKKLSEEFIEISVYTKGFRSEPVKLEVATNSDALVNLSLTKRTDNIFEVEVNVNNYSQTFTIEYNEGVEKNIKISTNIEKIGNIAINVKYSQKYDEPINEIERDDVITIDNLTNQELNQILNNFLSTEYVKLLNDELQFMPSTNIDINNLAENEMVSMDGKYKATTNVPTRFKLKDGAVHYSKVWNNSYNTKIGYMLVTLDDEGKYISSEQKVELMSRYMNIVSSNKVNYITVDNVEYGRYINSNEGSLVAYYWLSIDENSYALIQISITNNADQITDEELNQILKVKIQQLQ